MTRHNDINKAHALLSDTSWYITGNNQRKGKRKDKRRCKYYTTNNGCSLNHGKINSCVGASGCASYEVIN